LCGNVAACREMACVLFVVQTAVCNCNSVILLLTQYCADGKIETNERGRACDAYGGGIGGAQGVGGEVWEKEAIGETKTYVGG
jgi:hypothetical protein